MVSEEVGPRMVRLGRRLVSSQVIGHLVKLAGAMHARSRLVHEGVRVGYLPEYEWGRDQGWRARRWDQGW
jgi:hypothetical protein